MNFSNVLIVFLFFIMACGPESKTEKPRVSEYDAWSKAVYQPILIPDGIAGISSTARNFYIIMDGSGSMHDPLSAECSGDRTFSTKMEGARWALLQFLDSVPSNVNLGFYLFDNNGEREMVPLGANNAQAVREAIDQIREGGSTPLADAIAHATQELVKQYQQQLGYGEFRIIVVTDGIANSIPDAAIYAAQRGMPIYTIGLCVESDHPLRKYSVSYKAADNFQDLAEGLKDTLAELETFDADSFELPAEEAGQKPGE